MIVAIDGPAGAGKSTVARAVAAHLGAGYLDTGAIYRAVTWAVLRDGADPRDAAACTAVAAGSPVDLEPTPDGLRVLVGDVDVTEDIRAPRVTGSVSEVSAHPGVRAAVTEASRRIMAGGDWVSDGRDVGTVIVPLAEVKVFLTAAPRERARRRQADLAARGVDASLDEVLQDIAHRDHLDTTRAEGPLRRADGAVLIDSSDMTAVEVVEAIAALAGAAREAARR
ncbi:MAG: (d)CMP kinase [Thermoleophilia bacterium]|nr:(d)CMP kinase [Thermoleophilia bacterium]